MLSSSVLKLFNRPVADLINCSLRLYSKNIDGKLSRDNDRIQSKQNINTFFKISTLPNTSRSIVEASLDLTLFEHPWSADTNSKY